MVAAPSGDLETERLVLRRFRREDWRELQDYVSLPEVTRFDFEYPSTVEGCQELADYFSGQHSVWAVCLKDSGRLIGHVVSNQVPPSAFLTWDLGFIFNPAFESAGYASEACRRLIDHVFACLGAHRIESHCHPENIRSWRLLERLSMRREGHHVQNASLRREPDGSPIWWDTLDYAILREEWLALQQV